MPTPNPNYTRADVERLIVEAKRLQTLAINLMKIAGEIDLYLKITRNLKLADGL